MNISGSIQNTAHDGIKQPLHIAVAVVVNVRGEVLIAQRPPHAPQGGLWEFPGGKVEPGEDVVQALKRELKEEVGIEVEWMRPLIKTHHVYPDQEVLLDVWRVEKWRGQVSGCEGQVIAWKCPEKLVNEAFPEADKPIISAVKLPPLYLISPEPGPKLSAFLETLEACIEAGVRLFQLRAKTLPRQEFRALAGEVLRICNAHSAYLMLNASPAETIALGAHGVHLTSHWLQQLSERPLGKHYWVAASCHNATEVGQANQIGVDFIVLSPVYETASHPDAKPLGWSRFESLVARSKVPVFALGGLNPSHISIAWSHGGQGIAMVSGIWDALDPATVVQRTLQGKAGTQMVF